MEQVSTAQASPVEALPAVVLMAPVLTIQELEFPLLGQRLLASFPRVVLPPAPLLRQAHQLDKGQAASAP